MGCRKLTRPNRKACNSSADARVGKQGLSLCSVLSTWNPLLNPFHQVLPILWWRPGPSSTSSEKLSSRTLWRADLDVSCEPPPVLMNGCGTNPHNLPLFSFWPPCVSCLNYIIMSLLPPHRVRYSAFTTWLLMKAGRMTQPIIFSVWKLSVGSYWGHVWKYPGTGFGMLAIRSSGFPMF